MNDLQKLFLRELKDMYDGEQQLVEALPEMAKSAESPQLRAAFNEHLEQTKNHVNRLEQVFRALGEEPKRKTCQGLKGIIDEGELLAREFKDNSAVDAALIASGQKAEHYEITSYGTLCTWAKELGGNQILPLLKENLSEEKQADEKLSRLAMEERNHEAAMHDMKKKSSASASFSKMVGA